MATASMPDAGFYHPSGPLFSSPPAKGPARRYGDAMAIKTQIAAPDVPREGNEPTRKGFARLGKRGK